VRIHELAKELGTKSKDLVQALEQMGYAGLTASSSVPDEAVPRLRASGGKAVSGGKPRVVTEEPLPTRRRPRTRDAQPTAPAQTPTGDGQPAPQAAAEEALAPAPVPAEPEGRTVRISRGSTVKDVAERIGIGATDLIKKLFEAGEMVTITQSLSDDAIELLVRSHGAEPEIVAPEEAEEPEPEAEEVDPARLRPRPPVVTVMGHVDHGKTLLLDAIRESDVVSGEAGGITQHIGAYQVHQNGNVVTFIDTPGHEAFTAMRARGAQVTDIAVLVVAADDGVMPQTVEAIDHARAAGVPIVVAVNKVDKPEADPMRVRQQLAEQGVQTSEWGGDFEFVDVSAKTGQNLDKLLETILLVAELQELKADPEMAARGVAIEAHLDKGRGPVATVLVQRGTLRNGDAIVCGAAYGRVRAMLDEHGETIEEAPPGRPVLVLGWSKVPEAGDEFRVVADEKDARHIAQEREARVRAAEQVSAKPAVRLEDVLAQVRAGEVAELRVILKADTQGSLEALFEALEKLGTDEVQVRTLRRGVGAVTQSDVELAQADEAVVIGFNVRPDANAREAAEREGVDVRLYRVIYQAVDDIKQALSGLLAPEQQEVSLGEAEVRATFRVPRMGMVAGCYVTRGTLTRGARVRLVRDGAVVYDGRIGSLRRFKDDVREVAEGFECGVGLENFQDVKEGDVLEVYQVREVARSL
jgi:translation initiation factor IF-2